MTADTEHGIVIFNPSLPVLGGCLESPSEHDLIGPKKVECFKNASLDYVRDSCKNDYLQHVLRCIPVKGDRRYTLVDVKLHYLGINDCPCIPGWHIDGADKDGMLEGQGDHYTLFVTGDRARTRFMAEPSIMMVDKSLNMGQISKKYSNAIVKSLEPSTPKEWEIPKCTFASYDSRYFHRGVHSDSVGWRLLVRVTESNVILPNNSEFKCKNYR